MPGQLINRFGGVGFQLTRFWYPLGKCYLMQQARQFCQHNTVIRGEYVNFCSLMKYFSGIFFTNRKQDFQQLLAIHQAEHISDDAAGDLIIALRYRLVGQTQGVTHTALSGFSQ